MTVAAVDLVSDGLGDYDPGTPHNPAAPKPAALASTTGKQKLAAALLNGRSDLTEFGNAERFVRRHGADTRYCAPWHRWLLWDGMRWCPDDLQQVHELAKSTILSMYSEAAGLEGDAQRAALVKHARQSEKLKDRDALLRLAASDPAIAVRPDHLDLNDWALTVHNGVIDLRTGQLGPAIREDLSTKLAPVSYDPDARCPQWEQFLHTVFAGDTEVIDFVGRAVGYSLTGATSEQVMFVPQGGGANGKSTLLETITALLGDYSQQAPAEALLVRRDGGVPNDIARMRGARMITAVETGEGKRLDEARVKSLTGGDTVTARFLHGEFFDFRPKAKIWLATNHRPSIRGNDLGIWRRLILLPFTVTIPAADRDKSLPDKLLTELPGILAWAVRGCLDWQRGGLRVPDRIRAATEDYRQEQDTIGAFLTECCEPGGPDDLVPGADVYTAYTAWAKANGEFVLSQKLLGTRLHDRGYKRKKHGQQRRWHWQAVKLTADAQRTVAAAGGGLF